MSEQEINGFATMSSLPNELFYHHGIVADIDQDGVTDLFTVGERRYINEEENVDYAEAQWFRGQLMGDRFETTPRIIGPGLGASHIFAI